MPRVFKYEALYLEQKLRAEAAESEISRLTRERDEAIAVAVWAANAICIRWGGRLEYVDAEGDKHFKSFDGTDADIYRALKEARNGDRA